MSRPPKPALVLATEGRSHRTKEEIASRSEFENSLVTGEEFREWPSVRGSPSAHKEFLRLKKLLKNIQKNDALYQGVVNRYCLLKAESEDFEEKRERFYKQLSELEDRFQPEDRNLEYYQTLSKMQTQINACDKQIMAKRKMMLDIEKENIMTIAAALRAIPKRPGEGEEEDPMAALLSRYQA